MKKYFLVFKLAIQNLFEYKVDFLLTVAKYALTVIVMAIVWINVEKSGHVGLLSTSETISYFIFSAMLYSLSNFHPWELEADITEGYLSRFLVKPISPTLYYFCFILAYVTLETVLKMIVFLTILFGLHLLPSLSFTQLLVLIFYCPFIFIFSFQWLTLIALLTFWITQAYSVRWAVTIFTRLLSGILVPIVYFPKAIQQIVYYLPFEHLAFTPIEFMLGKIDIFLLLKSWVILCMWIIGLSIFRQKIWQKGLYQYEGTGI